MTTIIPRRADGALRLLLWLWLCAWAGPLVALELPLPEGAAQTVSRTDEGGRLAVPTGPWRADGGVPTEVIEGRVTRQAWQILQSQRTPTQLLSPIRDALGEAGFETQLDCADRRCGGFDFRFAIDVLPAPGMYVDLSNYRFLSAVGPDGAGVTVLTSRTQAAGYIQVLHVTPGAANGVDGDGPTADADGNGAVVRNTVGQGDIATLEARGAIVLSGVDFGSGAASLDAGPFPMLDALVTYLVDNPDRQILLVGHTDAVGSLAGNRALSQRRAAAVAEYLRAAGADPAQIASEGAGYLAPIASNLTEAGRRANRRVEAVLLPRE